MKVQSVLTCLVAASMLLPKSMVAARRLATATVTQKTDFYINPGVVDDTLLVQNGNTDNCVVQQNPAAVELFKGESKKYVYLVPQGEIPGCDAAPQRRVGSEVWCLAHLSKALSHVPHGHAVDARETPSMFGPCRFCVWGCTDGG